MSINIGPPQVDELKPRIAVIGVGGAGGNAIANMIAARVEGVEFIVANTDAQSLNSSAAGRRIQLGPHITQGLGAGSRPEVGRAAAEETIASVEEALAGAHMCFVAAGMGGGTGTGAAPVIAKAARDKGILTVGVVTKPFSFEGQRRMKSAEAGIAELQEHVDTLIVIPNQNLFLVASPNTTFKEAFLMADEVLQQGVRGITDLMVMPGLINLDFADVRSVMREMGKAMMGTGEAEGDGRALEAAQKAIANPLLDGVSMKGAKGVIVSITGGDDMRLMEVDEAANHIRELVDPDANIIFGSAFNDNLSGKIRVSVVATGIDGDGAAQGQGASPPASTAAAQAQPARGFGFGAGRAAAQGSASPRPAFAGFGGGAANAPTPAATATPASTPPVATDMAATGAAGSVPPLDRSQLAPGTGQSPAGGAAMEDEPLDLTAPLADDARNDARPGFTPVAGVMGAAMAAAPAPAVRPVPSYVDDAVADEPLGAPSASAAASASASDAAGDARQSGGPRLAMRGGAAPSPLDGGGIAPAPSIPPAASTGGTLFERMSRLSRGAAATPPADADAPADGVDIPRFLNRQNNP